MEDEYENEEYHEDYDNDYQDESHDEEFMEEKSETEIVTRYGTWQKLPSKPYKWESKPWAELTGFQRAMIRSRKFDDARGWGGRWIWTPHKTPESTAPTPTPTPTPAPAQKKPVFSYKAMLQKDEKPDTNA